MRGNRSVRDAAPVAVTPRRDYDGARRGTPRQAFPRNDAMACKESVMASDMFHQLVPVFSGMLNNLDAILTKAEQDAVARKIDPNVFLQARLAPDMLPFTRQIQIMSDQAKGGSSRLAGLEPPKWAD